MKSQSYVILLFAPIVYILERLIPLGLISIILVFGCLIYGVVCCRKTINDHTSKIRIRIGLILCTVYLILAAIGIFIIGPKVRSTAQALYEQNIQLQKEQLSKQKRESQQVDPTNRAEAVQPPL